MVTSERFAILLVLIGAGSRLLHLPPNIAAVTGVTIFAGYAIRNRWVAVLVPVAAMALADLVLGLYPVDRHDLAGDGGRGVHRPRPSAVR